MFRRSVLSISLPVEGRQVVHTIEVKHGGDPETGEIMASLYLDGCRSAISRVPARFPVAGGVIEVRTSEAGLRRCVFVSSDGSERQLQPDPASAEGRRLRLSRRHPAASRALGAAAVVALIVGLGVNLLQLAEPLSRIPLIAESIGVFESPIHLPWWVNLAIGVAAALGATDRALMMRYHWLLDSGAAT
ncbi:hypothetical protein [Microbacterium hydrocarbonoxydans]|uniref:hypothetical protein n=1 Tax=Microbacterium hydrocarbonoxydans TaxID=273678 RepID=UPI00203E8BB9|nr:hypothetical protein [Microbacterium hydrocarbonoxydans]MCM3781132.1 hypothetical protein [Microbacterium hydrocarbonoxydans]